MLEQPILPALPEPPGSGGSEQGPDAQYFANNPPGYKWKVLSTVIFGIFMVILDTTVVNVAFQTLRTEFGGSLASSQWMISIYVLALGISTPLAGYLANRFGGKTIYLGGLSLFAVGSLMCGLSPSLGLLIVARAIQGVGGGVALPLGTALLLQRFPAAEQGTALGIFGIGHPGRAGDRPHPGRLAGRPGPVAADLLYQPADRPDRCACSACASCPKAPAPQPASTWAGLITEVIGFGASPLCRLDRRHLGWTPPVTPGLVRGGSVGLVAFGLSSSIGPKTPCSTCACSATHLPERQPAGIRQRDRPFLGPSSSCRSTYRRCAVRRPCKPG